jgi:hypothetical protein
MADMEAEMLEWLLSLLFDTDAGPRIDPEG